jgi:hypothetical protein
MVMEVSEVAPANALFPIDVTLAGMGMEVSAVAPANAFCGIVVRLLPAANETEASEVA